MMLFYNDIIPDAYFSWTAVQCYYANKYYLTGEELMLYSPLLIAS